MKGQGFHCHQCRCLLEVIWNTYQKSVLVKNLILGLSMAVFVTMSNLGVKIGETFYIEIYRKWRL